MLVTDLLRRNAHLWARETALVAVEAANLTDPGPESYLLRRESLTWEEMNRQANQIAHFYLSIGIHRGSHVGLMMKNQHRMAAHILRHTKIRRSRRAP